MTLQAPPILMALLALGANPPTDPPAEGEAAEARVPSALPLAFGEPLERRLEAGEVHTYPVRLEAGDVLQATVTLQGEDVDATVSGPDGVLLAADRDDFRFGVERVTVVAAAAGEHRLAVRAGLRRARYVLEAARPRAATAQDHARVRVEAALAAGRGLLRQEKADANRDARAHLERALAEARALGAGELEAAARVDLGRAHTALGEHPQAIETFREALRFWEATGSERQEARTRRLLGASHYYLSDYPAALAELEQALRLQRRLDDRAGQAEVLGDLSHVRRAQGAHEQAIEAAEDAVSLWNTLDDAAGMTSGLDALGLAYYDARELQRALDIFLRLLPRQRGRSGEADTLVNVGAVHGWLGEMSSALDHFAQAVPLYREHGDRRGEANAVNNMGVMAHSLERYDAAVEHLDRSRAIQRELGDRRGEAMSLINLARSHARRGEPERGAPYLERALDLTRQIGDRRNESAALDELGSAWIRRGERDKGFALYEQALALARASGDRLREAALFSRIAGVLLEGGDLVGARSRIESAVALLEEMRRSVRSRALQATFLASVRSAYERYIDVLMRLHQVDPSGGLAAEAFTASERFRARGLLELLVVSQSDAGSSAEQPFAERERALQDQLTHGLERQMRLRERDRGGPEAARLAREMETSSRDLDHVRGLRQAEQRRRAALLAPEPMSIPAVQRELLDPDAVLLEYVLGLDRSYLWAVTTTSWSTYTLPRRADVESAARKAHEILAARRAAEPDPELDAALRSLTATLLAPAAEAIRGRRVVVVVADGALQYVPFAALPDPGAPERPLVADHDVVGAPSASILRVLRREAGRRSRPARVVAVLADPVFGRDDERLKAAVPARSGPPAGGTAAEDRRLGDALRESGIEGGLSRLPFSRREARGILDLVAEEKRHEALDFEASRATALDPELGDYRFVHFATHGFVNSARPELSGVVLSLVDREGRDQRGFLAAPEVSRMRLAADLVALSGCRTALGRELTGEGLVGLSQAFMHAGASRVLGSLWRVDDAATAELMTQVYRGMLVDGLGPAAALSAAQRALSAHRRYAPPFFWAAFQIQGDWR